MAKKSFNESRKSTIQNTSALTAHSTRSEHSSSSSEHKSSNKSKRFTHFYLGSVDTRSSEVDTRPSFQQTSLPNWESRSTLDQVVSTLVPGSVDTVPGSVDTRSGQVDTRPSFQQTSLPNWESRSTLDQGRSTHSG
ncbi:hypothetical protein Taro_054942 [Colocasia esculenta]|uniref:Uncharacterized protein n=1 Tax=Colocasia esculenta TaxID=4460 RepID=A0A843XSQ1_COLES|nr:hypothetical protein [Colocasia esculenta]